MGQSFRNVGVIGRVDSPSIVESVRELVKVLEARQLKIVLESQTSAALEDPCWQVTTRKMIGEMSDLVIVVGGDGSLLGAARELARHDALVLGINRGQLGFLTDIAPDDIEREVNAVLDGEFFAEERFLLQMQLNRDGAPVAESNAFNDVVLHSGQAPKMLNFDLFIEGEFVYSQRSDGLIVSTPTGSTAYSLSGGGPIMHPRLNALAVVPMFPHTLTSRPLVVDAESEVKILIGESNPSSPTVSCDGQVNSVAKPGDVIKIKKYRKKIKLVHPLGHEFYATCRDKLGWGTQFVGRDKDESL